jgi:hypothetical protein
MADFRIWVTINHIGPHQFSVIVSAVPHDARDARVH